MANPVDVSVLVSQLPRVQKMQEDAQRLPQLLQDQLSREVIEKQKRELHEVQRTEKSEASAAVDREKQGSEQQGRGKQGRKKEQGQEQELQDSEREEGRLIDLKI
ncbi:MAG: hypothetical protein ACLFRL_06245 [Desulfohalobiaceae bacterium]